MRNLLIATLFIFTFSVANAQMKPRFGLHFSPNFGWLKPTADKVEKDGTNFGYSFGLNLDLELGSSENYAIATGVSVFNTAGSLNIQEADTSQIALGSFTANARYIEIPVALKLKTNEIGYFTYFGKFGLSNAILIQSSADEAGTEFKKYNDNLNFFRSALLIGLGAEYNLSGNTSIFFGVDFNNGFTNFFKKEEKSGMEKTTSGQVVINLGLYF